MLSRDNIISTTLLKLGEVSVYNDNRSEEYKIADKLLNNVIENIASRNDFLFNSKTVELTSVGKDMITEENIFNLPIDFLNKISFIDNEDARLESEFIYSNSDTVKLQYCRKIDFSEFPNYLFNYIVYALSTEMAETYSVYNDRLGMLNSRLEQERANIYSIQYQYKKRVF